VIRNLFINSKYKDRVLLLKSSQKVSVNYSVVIEMWKRCVSISFGVIGLSCVLKVSEHFQKIFKHFVEIQTYYSEI
jgi:hypothetical protein